MTIRYAVAILATVCTLPTLAHADITIKSQDGGMELPLPNGWREVKPEGPMTKLVGADGRGSRVAVRLLPKEDFKDAKATANFIAGRLKLTDSEGMKVEDVQVGGKPAVRLNVLGTQPSGKRVGYIITVFESGANYVAVVGLSDASAFAKQTPVLTNFATQLKVTASAAAPAAATGASTPKPQPPK